MDKIKEFCGLFGIWGSTNAVELTYLGLYALQHRGQESAGIASIKDGKLVYHREMGLVTDIFTREILDKLKSSAAIGHVRYSTTGSSNLINTQPLVVNYQQGMLAVAHNGNLVNSGNLRTEFELRGSIFQTTMDSEIIVHILASPGVAGKQDAIKKCLNRIKGAYSLLFLTPTEMVVARDPNGFRPLCLGQIKGLFPAYAVASETCAFDLAKIEYIRDIEPGEILYINEKGMRSERIVSKDIKPSFCIFEHVYFARPDSRINGDTVHEVRRRLGKALAREHPVNADLVAAIPDSGNSAAVGYAEESGIPFDQGFVRNHYVGRTFIEPIQAERDIEVKIKLNVVEEVVKGKRIIIIDDSIIRGTTSKSRIKNLRDAGAKEVHMRISCPSVISPCYYGIDFPTKKELIAANMDIESIRNYLELDSLSYLSIEGLLGAVSNPKDHYCTACYTGKYPIPIEDEFDKFVLEK